MYAIRSYYATGGVYARSGHIVDATGSVHEQVLDLAEVPVLTGRHNSVITSYSIHYTKLYEPSAGWSKRWRLAAT